MLTKIREIFLLSLHWSECSRDKSQLLVQITHTKLINLKVTKNKHRLQQWVDQVVLNQIWLKGAKQCTIKETLIKVPHIYLIIHFYAV
jgi:hypothetical protein